MSALSIVEGLSTPSAVSASSQILPLLCFGSKPIDSQFTQSARGFSYAAKDPLELKERVQKLRHGAAEMSKVKVNHGHQIICRFVKQEVGGCYCCVPHITAASIIPTYLDLHGPKLDDIPESS